MESSMVSVHCSCSSYQQWDTFLYGECRSTFYYGLLYSVTSTVYLILSRDLKKKKKRGREKEDRQADRKEGSKERKKERRKGSLSPEKELHKPNQPINQNNHKPDQNTIKTTKHNWERIAISIESIGVISVFRKRSVTKCNLWSIHGLQENDILFAIVAQ